MASTPLSRRHLLSTTALQVVVLIGAAPAAHAQGLSANARPVGGSVVAGSAAISGSANITTIDQTSNRAAINWQSFNVGSNQSVAFQQPSASAVVLNRVTGPDPSAIAGRIDANGEVIITNPSGVVFSRGAQVNAQSLVVSAAGITNKNFSAGRMVFDQAASPNARVVNRGTITVREAGLAALVAPSVRNAGVIRAKLGRVVLAGAATETLDMYGDGLVSLDVGSQVKQVPVGRDGRPVAALVTNTGTIVADGGTVELTAAAADGVVQTLVDARGTIRADSLGGRTGAIAINGTGGAVVIEGTLAADGGATGAGNAGAIALGTDLARAQGSGSFPAGTSETTIVAPAARITANATGRGRGGRVTVLSTENTVIAGSIAARGGPRGGDGGTVELSGEDGFALSGTVDTAAPLGRLGTIVLDPTNLTIVNFATADVITPGTTEPNIGYGTGTGSATVSASSIEALTGNIDLQATNSLAVAASISLSAAQSLTLEAGNNLTVEAGNVINAGTIDLEAAAASAGADRVATGALDMAGTLLAGSVVLGAGSGGITLSGGVAAYDGDAIATSLTVNTTGPVADATGATLSVGTLSGIVGSLSLVNDPAVVTLGSLTATNGAIVLTGDVAPLTVTGPVVAAGGAGDVTLGVNQGSSLTLAGDVMGKAVSINAVTLNQTTGTIDATTLNLNVASGSLADANAIGTLEGYAGALTLNDASPLTLAETLTLGDAANTIQSSGGIAIAGAVLGSGPLTLAAGSAGIAVSGTIALPSSPGGDLVLQTSGPVTEGASGAVTAYDVGGTASSVDLPSTGNFISNFGTLNLRTGGDVTLVDAGTLTVGGGYGTLTAGGNVTLVADNLQIEPDEGLPVVSALGTVAIAPLTAGTDITVSSDDAAYPGLVLPPEGLSSISAPALELGVPGHKAAAIVFGGTAAIGTLDFSKLVLNATGSVTQSQPLVIGTLAAGGTLAGAAGTLALASTGNVIGTLDGFVTTAGSIDLASTTPIAVTGTVSAAGGTGEVALVSTATGDALALAGLVDAGTLNLTAASGQVLQSGGSIVAGTLSGQAAGFSLLSAANTISTLADIVTRGSLLLAETGSLELAGSVQAGSATLAIGGTLTADQNADVTVGELSGSAAAVAITVPLEAGFFDVGTLGDWTTTDGFLLQNLSSGEDAGLTLAGTIVDAEEIAITSAGPVTVTGQVRAPLVSIEASNTPETDGPVAAIDNGTLDVAAGASIFGTSSVALTGGNVLAVANGATITSNAAVDLTSNGAMTLAGTIAGPAVDLVANTGSIPGDFPTVDPGSITENGGAILAETLSGFSAGSADIVSAGNSVTAIGTLTSEGGLALMDAAATLDVLGLLADPGQVVLAGTSAIRLDGTLSAASIVLDGVGAVTGTGVIGGETLSGTAASLSLLGAANSLDVLGALATAGNLALADTSPLTATGTVSVGNGATLAIQDDDFAIGTAGALVAPGGRVALAPFTAGGTLTLGGTASGLGDDPAITAETLVLGSGTAGNVTVAGSVDLTGVPVLDLLSAGTAGEAAGAALTVGTLEAQAAAVTFGGANAIATLGTITSNGDISITDGRVGQPETLLAAGPLTATAGTITLTASGTLTIAALATASAIDLAAPSIVQTGGTLAGGGSIVLAGDGVAIGGSIAAPAVSIAAAETIEDGVPVAFGTIAVNAGGVVSGAGVTLDATGPLTVAAGGTVAATVDASLTSDGAMSLGGTLAAPVVNLVANDEPGQPQVPFSIPGSITQTGGAILAGTLSGLSTGTLALVAAGNSVDAIGTLTSETGLALADAAPTLAIAGLLSDPGRVVLEGSSAIRIAGVLSSATIVLDDVGAVTGTGALLGETLTGSAAAISLPGAGNSLDVLGPLTVAGNLAIADADPLTAAGTVTVGTGGTLAIADDDFAIGTAGALVAPDGTVALAPFTAGDALTLDNDPATVANTLILGSPTAGNVTIAGSVDLTGVSVLDLVSAGSVAEAAGAALTVGTLEASAAAVALDGANTISTLGPITATGSAGGISIMDGGTDGDTVALLVAGPLAAPGTITLTDTGALTVAGSVSASAVDLVANSITQTGGTIGGAVVSLAADGDAQQVGGAIVASGSLAITGGGATTIDGVLAAPTLTLAGSSITEGPQGAISAGALAASSGGAVVLGGTANSIATLAQLTGSALTLDDASPLAIAGPVATPGTLVLAVAGSVAETAGASVSASALAASVDALALTSAANSISTLDAISASGTLAISDAAPVVIAGLVQAAGTLSLLDDAVSFAPGGTLAAPGGVVALAELSPGAGFTLGSAGSAVGSNPPIVAGTLVLGDATGGAVTIGGSFDLANIAALDILSAGAITETAAGVLSVATLDATGASVTLASTANDIAALGMVTATAGPIVIGDASPTLAIDGAVQTPGSLVLTDAAGSVTEGPAGLVSAARLAGTAAALDLGSAGNVVGTLDALATTGAMTIADGPALAIGRVAAGTTMAIAVNAGPIAIVGPVTADLVSLAAADGITEGVAAGVTASLLSAVAPGLQLTSANNRIAALGAVDVQNGLAITDGEDLALTGAIGAASATFDVTGSISQPSGTLTTSGVLTGSATGAATFGTGGVAVIGTLGSFSAGTTLTLAADPPLVIAGTIAAPFIAISAPGTITLVGGAIETTGLAASAESGVTPTAPGSYIEVLPDASGNSVFTQVGTTTVAPDGNGASTLRIALEGTGSLVLDDLVAPQTTIVLDPGRGAATGDIDAGGLTVVDQGGSAELTGSVANESGAMAAMASGITPTPDLLYELNGCEIAAGCSTVAANPLDLGGDVSDAILTPDVAIASLVSATGEDDEHAKHAAKAPLLSFTVLDLAIGRDGGEAAVELPNISNRDY